jgi:hypothetical protein
MAPQAFAMMYRAASINEFDALNDIRLLGRRATSPMTGRVGGFVRADRPRPAGELERAGAGWLPLLCGWIAGMLVRV